MRLNQLDASKALGCTARSLRDWSKLSGFPDCSRGYNVEAIRVWLAARKEARSTSKYKTPAVDDWTTEDWKDLFLMTEAFKRRIGERHANRGQVSGTALAAGLERPDTGEEPAASAVPLTQGIPRE